MIKAINAGFGMPIAHELPEFIRRGIGAVRQGPTHAEVSDETLAQLIGEFVNQPMRLHLVVGGQLYWNDGRRLTTDDISALAERVLLIAQTLGVIIDMEVGNEPDLGVPFGEIPPSWYAALVQAVHQKAQAHSFLGRIFCGGVMRWSQGALKYLKAMIATGLIPDDVIVCPHRYPTGQKPENPDKGFANREAEWQAFRDAVAPRQLACSELGYTTAKIKKDGLEGILGGTIQLTEQQQADALKWELAFMESHGLERVCLYQLNDGLSDAPIDRYGLRRTDGQWKAGDNSVFAVPNPGTIEPDTGTTVAITSPHVIDRGNSMKVGLRHQGHAIGIDPGSAPVGITPELPNGFLPVYANREKVAEWEEGELTPLGDGKFSFLFLATKRQLSIQPGGYLESRDAGNVGAYETFQATHQPDGEALLYRVIEPGSVPTVLTIEARS